MADDIMIEHSKAMFESGLIGVEQHQENLVEACYRKRNAKAQNVARKDLEHVLMCNQAHFLIGDQNA